MSSFFNNYNLSNEEIEKIIREFRPAIKRASKLNGIVDEDCESKIMITLFEKLSRNRKNKNF